MIVNKSQIYGYYLFNIILKKNTFTFYRDEIYLSFNNLMAVIFFLVQFHKYNRLNTNI